MDFQKNLICLTALAAAGLALVLATTAGASGPGDYYKGINPDDGQLKKQLQPLLLNHKVLSYGDDWGALDKVDRFLSTHCQAPKIPDIYSNYCWSNDKGAGGECGNYKKEGDCWNREQ